MAPSGTQSFIHNNEATGLTASKRNLGLQALPKIPLQGKAPKGGRVGSAGGGHPARVGSAGGGSPARLAFDSSHGDALGEVFLEGQEDGDDGDGCQRRPRHQDAHVNGGLRLKGGDAQGDGVVVAAPQHDQL